MYFYMIIRVGYARFFFLVVQMKSNVVNHMHVRKLLSRFTDLANIIYAFAARAQKRVA